MTGVKSSETALSERPSLATGTPPRATREGGANRFDESSRHRSATRCPGMMTSSQHIYEVCFRKDKRGAGQKNRSGEITA